MRRHAGARTVPVRDDALRVGVALGVVQHDVALECGALRPMGESRPIVLDDARLRAERLDVGARPGALVRCGGRGLLRARVCPGHSGRFVRGSLIDLQGLRHLLVHNNGVLERDRRLRLRDALGLRPPRVLRGATRKDDEQRHGDPRSAHELEQSAQAHDSIQHDSPFPVRKTVRRNGRHVQGRVDRVPPCGASERRQPGKPQSRATTPTGPQRTSVVYLPYNAP